MLRLLLIACLFALVSTVPGGAQPPANEPAAKPAPALTPAQARQVLDTINDPQKRARFTATLEAIAKSLPPPEPAPAQAPPPPAEPATQTPSLTQNGLGAAILL